MFGSHLFGRKSKKGRVVLDRREDIEPNEIFYDYVAKRQEESQDAAEKKFEISLPGSSLKLPFAIAGIFFLLVLARVAQLQLLAGDTYARQAEQNKYLFYKVQSDRGIIYDKDFKPLVNNLSTFDLECDLSKLPGDEAQSNKIILSLAAAVNMDAAQLKDHIKNEQDLTLENIDHRSLIILEARITDFPGCEIVSRPIRDYAQGAGLSHLLGYMGKIDPDEWRAAADIYSINDYIGRSGLEKSYEDVLRKDPGKLRVERDAKGNIISRDVSVSPESGDSVQLWLDYGLQEKLHQVMAAQLKSLGLERGAAVALNPKTGGVLAMVSFPDYDDNVFASGDSQAVSSLFSDKNNPLFNRVISGKYLTGSTIKPLEAVAALQEKLIDPNKNISCQGKLVVQNKYNPDIVYNFNDNHVHGSTNMYKAIAESCNVYFQTIGGGYGSQEGLGPSRIKKYLGLFGWESLTNIDLPGEVAGFIPDQEWKKQKFAGTQDSAWGDGDTYNLAIGQGFIGITPIEVAAAYAAIANGGTLYQPQMVMNVVDSQKNLVEEKKPVVLNQNFIDPDNLRVVREGMRHGVNGANAPLASALTLNSLPVQAAAKTGTAQLRKGADGKDLSNAWVATFAPYDDPQIVLVVMAEDVHEGTVAVLPVAKEVLNWYFGPKEQPEAGITADGNPDGQVDAGDVSGGDAGVGATEAPATITPGGATQVVPGEAQDLIPLLNLGNDQSQPAKPEEVQ